MGGVVAAAVIVALLFLCVTGGWGQIGPKHRR